MRISSLWVGCGVLKVTIAAGAFSFMTVLVIRISYELELHDIELVRL